MYASLFCFFSIFLFLFLRGGNFAVVGTVPVTFSFGNFSRDIVRLEADEKQIRLCETVDLSFKLGNLDSVYVCSLHQQE